jgi:hypothetical protein
MTKPEDGTHSSRPACHQHRFVLAGHRHFARGATANLQGRNEDMALPAEQEDLPLTSKQSRTLPPTRCLTAVYVTEQADADIAARPPKSPTIFVCRAILQENRIPLFLIAL